MRKAPTNRGFRAQGAASLGPTCRSDALSRSHIALLSILLLGGPAAGSAAEVEKPLWELGIGMSALYLPDYRGSDEAGIFVIPFPYVVYRAGK